MKQFNIFFGICVGLLVAGVVYMTLGFPADVQATRFGPAYYPITLACVIALLLVLFLLENRRATSETLFSFKQMRHPIFLGTAFIALIFLLEPLGFLLCGFAFLSITTRVLGTSYKRSLVIAAAITGAIYVLFKLVLKVPIPLGTVWESIL